MHRPQGLRERKNEEAKRALYEAAMELFQEKGFEATSIDEIAERAGFSRATFFNHFSAKKGVLRHYGQEIQNRVEEMIDNSVPITSPLELIRELILCMVSEAKEHRDELKLIYTHSMRDPDYMFDPTPARMRIFEAFTELVEEAGKLGQIRQDLPSREIALHILSVYQGVVLSIITGLANSEDLVHSAWQFIVGGLRDGNCAAR